MGKQFLIVRSKMWCKCCLIFLLLLPFISPQTNFPGDNNKENDNDNTNNNDTGSGFQNADISLAASSKGNVTAGCSVATSESTGLYHYIYTLRESIQPNRTTMACKTVDDSACQALQCCFSQSSTSVRPGVTGSCILHDWVLPVAGGLVLALLFSVCLCCCCYCCSARKRSDDYELPQYK